MTRSWYLTTSTSSIGLMELTCSGFAFTYWLSLLYVALAGGANIRIIILQCIGKLGIIQRKLGIIQRNVPLYYMMVCVNLWIFLIPQCTNMLFLNLWVRHLSCSGVNGCLGMFRWWQSGKRSRFCCSLFLCWQEVLPEHLPIQQSLFGLLWLK